MALYSVIGVEFTASIMKQMEALVEEKVKGIINKTLKQVSHDYSLDYKELKARYCDPSSFEMSVPTPKKVVPVVSNKLIIDLAEPSAPVINFVATMAISKMKKPDLVTECDMRGIDSEGTVTQLKERVKLARESDSPKAKVKAAPKPRVPKEPKKKEVPPPPPPVSIPLEEEEDEEEECLHIEDEMEDIEDEMEFEEEDLQTRLRKILLEAEEEADED
jgi:hypothetical protein